MSKVVVFHVFNNIWSSSSHKPWSLTILGCSKLNIIPISLVNSRVPCFDSEDNCLIATIVPSNWTPCILWNNIHLLIWLTQLKLITIIVHRIPCKLDQILLLQSWEIHRSCLLLLWFVVRWIHSFVKQDPFALEIKACNKNKNMQQKQKQL